jgi:hypothetical protein
MGVRLITDKDAHSKFNERILKQVGRLYILWLAGILVGVVKLRPEHIELGGVKYQITNPEALEGIIFFGCILYYIGIIANASIFQLEYGSGTTLFKRRIIFTALGTKKKHFKTETVFS